MTRFMARKITAAGSRRNQPSVTELPQQGAIPGAEQPVDTVVEGERNGDHKQHVEEGSELDDGGGATGDPYPRARQSVPGWGQSEDLGGRAPPGERRPQTPRHPRPTAPARHP